MKTTRKLAWAIIPLVVSVNLYADQVINDDLIITSSACMGFDCVNGESFGFDTLRLKENNVRIKFDDTSSTGSFPNNDWQLTANDATNGGQNKFSIDDTTSGRTPFTIEASAPSHSLYVDNGGNIGLGTNNPVVQMHVVDGNTPTMRLEQNGSSGFSAQTWDVAGNETNFFIRDVSNGTTLPFRIKPGAPTNSLYIDTDGDIGLGTASPDSQLHVYNSSSLNNNKPIVLIENADPTLEDQLMLKLVNKNGDVRLEMENQTTGITWRITNDDDNLVFSKVGSGKVEFMIDGDGNVTTSGDIIFSDDGIPTTLSSLVDRIEALEN
jgi:predicted secreted protein